MATANPTILSHTSAAWLPGTGFVCQDDQGLDHLPDGRRESEPTSYGGGDSGTLIREDDGKRTYVPKKLYDATNNVSLAPPWGDTVAHGLGSSPWVHHNQVGQYVLIRGLCDRLSMWAPPGDDEGADVKLCDGRRWYVGPQPYLHLDATWPWDATVAVSGCRGKPNLCWRFALVSAYNSSTGTHTLTFLDHDVYFTGYQVNLKNCLFQLWSPAELLRLLAPKPPHRSVQEQKVRRQRAIVAELEHKCVLTSALSVAGQRVVQRLVDAKQKLASMSTDY